jgi:exopolysaccharide biosynthesis polyprenyl glycosylphosphotransferase
MPNEAHSAPLPTGCGCQVSTSNRWLVGAPDAVADDVLSSGSRLGEAAPPLDTRSGARRYRRLTRTLAALDAACGLMALLVFYFLGDRPVPSGPGRVAIPAMAALLWTTVFHLFGLHRVGHLSPWDEFRRITGATIVGSLIVVAAGSWGDQALSRTALAGTIVFGWVLETLIRGRFRSLIDRQKRLGHLSLRTLIVGTNSEAHRLANQLAQAGRGFLPVGYVATRTANPGLDGIPVLGRIETLWDLIRYHDIDCVFLESTALSAEEMMEVTTVCRWANVEMKVSARSPDVLTSRIAVERLDDGIALTIKPVRLTGVQTAMKRSFDVILASVTLVVALPFMVMIGLAVRLTSPGPILFLQRRVTKEGRVFTMYKFRTMVEDPERVLESTVIDLTKPFFKLKDDPRLTRVGRFLRTTSLDEIPQLWNVIVGDMSLVGPRPLPVEQVVANSEFLRPRHEVPAGITGWWQISGRSELDSDEALRLDRFYIENWSLALDAYILLKTIGAVLAKKGAH